MPLECLRVKGGMGKKPERVSERRHEQSSRFGRDVSGGKGAAISPGGVTREARKDAARKDGRGATRTLKVRYTGYT